MKREKETETKTKIKDNGYRQCTGYKGRRTQDKGQRTNDKGRRTKEKDNGLKTKDKGRRTKDRRRQIQDTGQRQRTEERTKTFSQRLFRTFLKDFVLRGKKKKNFFQRRIFFSWTFLKDFVLDSWQKKKKRHRRTDKTRRCSTISKPLFHSSVLVVRF